jgi:signal transduction histidine kinase
MNHDQSMPKVTPIRGVVPPRRISGRAARAHEEMNALSVISSVASLLAPGLSERDRLRMDRLNRAVDRLRDLIRDDVDEARDFIATSVPQPIDVEALVRGVCELLRERAEDAGIQIVVDCGGGLLDGDAAPLEETLFELVGNAIDATLPGRAVHLETRVTLAGDQVWTIQGSGAPRPARLMLSASVAMSYGGSLAFESREGEGTTVRVWLPRVARKGELPTLSSRAVRPVDVVELRRG